MLGGVIYIYISKNCELFVEMILRNIYNGTMTRQKAEFLQNTYRLTDSEFAKRTYKFVFFIDNFDYATVF